MLDNLCHCNTGKPYAECCELYITGAIDAPTAEALMRSRYTAYAVHAIDYIVNTSIDKDKINRDGILDWSWNSRWLGLKINSANCGIKDETGSVEFEATYERKGLKHIHHEKAWFIKREGRWLYGDGDIFPKAVTRAHVKFSRNDPCYCSSGKKYKHCCGR